MCVCVRAASCYSISRSKWITVLQWTPSFRSPSPINRTLTEKLFNISSKTNCFVHLSMFCMLEHLHFRIPRLVYLRCSMALERYNTAYITLPLPLPLPLPMSRVKIVFYIMVKCVQMFGTHTVIYVWWQGFRWI